MPLIILKYLHSKSLVYDALVPDDCKAKKKNRAKGLWCLRHSNLI